ncbi:hypothetical protein AAY473_000725 [Plecturocebus cupreus]
MGSCFVAQVGVQWCDHSSLQLPTPGLKQSRWLTLPKTGSFYVAQADVKLASSERAANGLDRDEGGEKMAFGMTEWNSVSTMPGFCSFAVAMMGCFWDPVGSRSIIQAGCHAVITAYCSLQLLSSRDPPTSASQVAGTTGIDRVSLLLPRPVLNFRAQAIKGVGITGVPRIVQDSETDTSLEPEYLNEGDWLRAENRVKRIHSSGWSLISMKPAPFQLSPEPDVHRKLGSTAVRLPTLLLEPAFGPSQFPVYS